MKLSTNCPHRRSAKNWRPRLSVVDDPDQPPRCRMTDGDGMRVFNSKRGPLCENQKHTPEEYRFTWRSSFDGSAVIQIGEGKNIILDWARDSFGGNGRFWRCVERADWERLQAAVLKANFWALEPMEDRMGLDGADWVIEGRRRDVYRAVNRWSPSGAIYDLGRAFFDIAGPPIADIRLY
jgi:hypothetical protein